MSFTKTSMFIEGKQQMKLFNLLTVYTDKFGDVCIDSSSDGSVMVMDL